MNNLLKIEFLWLFAKLEQIDSLHHKDSFLFYLHSLKGLMAMGREEKLLAYINGVEDQILREGLNSQLKVNILSRLESLKLHDPLQSVEPSQLFDYIQELKKFLTIRMKENHGKLNFINGVYNDFLLPAEILHYLKLVLTQLGINSIEHGLGDSRRDLKIEINQISANEIIYCDNGIGMNAGSTTQSNLSGKGLGTSAIQKFCSLADIVIEEIDSNMGVRYRFLFA